MPPRPAGTDGADHSYREVIVERYKRMADFKEAIQKLIGLHMLFVFVKVAWSFAVFKVGGPAVPMSVLGMVGLELLLQVVLAAAKLGQRNESLALLKTFNMVQAFLTATQVLSAWQYHQGTNSEGIPTYSNSKIMAAYLQETYPAVVPGNVLELLKANELFQDMTAGVLLIMATFVSHKMILEKMQMKAEKNKVSQDRKGAIKGGDSDSDEDDSEDDKGAPDAVPISQEKPKVAKAAAASMRRRHA